MNVKSRVVEILFGILFYDVFNKLNKCEVEIGGSWFNSLGSLFYHIQQKFKIHNL